MIDRDPALGGASLPRITLVLGGARSGKSRHAEALVTAAAAQALYIATAEARDDEMATRIAAHRARRGPFWTTLEAPFLTGTQLAAAARPDQPVLVDCLTLWLSNHLLAEHDVEAECDAFCAALPTLAGPVVLVANEVGLGIVPDNALGRRFRDLAGWFNQRVAAAADRVTFIAAGLPLILKQE